MKAETRYYLTADRSRLVAEGDPDADTLYAAEGATISAADAKKYGLVQEEAPAEAVPPEPAPADAAKAVKEPPANKAIKGPEESK
jgi:enoyl-CoA hydratase/carnithine racemase